MHMPNRDTYLPAVVLAMERLTDRNVSEVRPPTSKGNDVTKDGEAITKGDVEVLFPSEVRVPSIRERKNSGKRPRGEREQQSDRGIESEGLGNTREILTK